MPDVDNIEKRIKTTLEDIARNDNLQAIVGTAASTLLIKKKFVKIAHQLNLLAGTRQRKECEADEGEWLYDMCWFTYERGTAGYLTSLPLAMECEWNPDPDIDGDFMKLVQARADLRVWIFKGQNADTINGLVTRYREQTRRFGSHVSGDRYLIAGFNESNGQFHFYSISVP